MRLPATKKPYATADAMLIFARPESPVEAAAALVVALGISDGVHGTEVSVDECSEG